MPFSPRLLLALVLLALASQAAAAVDFRTLGWNRDVSELYYTSGGKTVALSADETHLSETYTLLGDGPLELFRIETVNGEKVRKPVASFPIPPNLTRALLLLHVGKDGTCAGKWLDDSVTETPAGMMRIHNLSSREVAVNIGTDVMPLHPGMAAVVPVPPEVRSMPVRVATLLEGKWEYALSISQPVRTRLRLMAFIRDGRPTIDEPDRILDWLAFHEVPRP